MATPKALDALNKTKEALVTIKDRLQPVLQKLNEDAFEKESVTAQAQATVALSIGMMKYMGVRLRGLDQGRKADDPLRKELNKMKLVLAEIKKKYAEKTKDGDKTLKKKPPAKQASAKKDTTSTADKKKEAGPSAKDKANESKAPKKIATESNGDKKRKSPASERKPKKRRST
jgi:hypothetical protein